MFEDDGIDEQDGNDFIPLPPKDSVTLPEINYVELVQTIPTIEKMTPSMQEYVMENFQDFSEQELAMLKSEDVVMSVDMLRERVVLDDARLAIFDAFKGEPTQDSVNEDREVQASRIRSRLLELYPDAEDMDELVDTIDSVISQEEYNGNPASALYREGGFLNDTTFSELESYTNVGAAFRELSETKSEIDIFDLDVGNPFPTVEEATGVSVAQSALDLAMSGLAGVLESGATVTEIPALAVDAGDVLGSIVEPYTKPIQELILANPDISPFALETHASIKGMRNDIRNFFRKNPIAETLRGVIEAPTDFDGDMFGRLQQGDVAGAGKQAGYMLTRLAGEVVGLGVLGAAAKALKVGVPRMSVAFGGLAAERQFQHLTDEGIDQNTAFVNSLAYGVINGVLSEYLVIEKLRHVTRIVGQDFGAATGREFAIGAVSGLAKTMAFDGALMGTTEGMLAVVDYATGVSNESLVDAAFNRTANGMLLGMSAGLAFGAPSRMLGFRNRNIRAQEHVNATLAATEIYNMMADIPNQRMREAVATFMSDSADLPNQMYVHPNALGETLRMTETQLIEATGIPSDVIAAAREANQGVSVPMVTVLGQMALHPEGLDLAQTRMTPDGPTAHQSATYVDAVDSFYRGLLRRELRVGTLADSLAAKVGLKDVPPARSSDSLVRSASTYVKTFWNNFYGTAREQFRRREMSTEFTTRRRPIVDFTATEIPDVPIPAETLKTAPETLVDPAQVFPARIVTEMAQAEGLRNELDNTYEAFSDTYKIVTDADRVESGAISGTDQATYNVAKLQYDIYQSILNNDRLQKASDILMPDAPIVLTESPFSPRLGQPLKIDYNMFKQVFGERQAKRLSRGLRKTLFTDSAKEGVTLNEALNQFGMSSAEFIEMLSDPDVRGMISAKSLDSYALSQSKKLSAGVLKKLEQYNELVNSDNDPTIAAYTKWLKDGEANETIARHLSDNIDALRRDELKNLETQLTKEFRRQTSPLIKGGRLTPEARQKIQLDVLNLDYKYIKKDAFIKDALSLEKFYNLKSAEMVKVGNLNQAYNYKAQSIKMREYVKAQYKAIRAIKEADKVVDKLKSTELSEFNAQGYDTDYVLGARLVLERAGIKRQSRDTQAQLEALADYDSYKYEKLVYEFDPYIPETRAGMSAQEYINIANKLNDIVEGARGEALNYTLDGVTAGEMASSIYTQLLDKQVNYLDGITKGQFKPTYKAALIQAYQNQLGDATGMSPAEISARVNVTRAQQLAFDSAQAQLGLRDNPDLISSMAGRIGQGFGLISDFLKSLNIPELTRITDLMRDSASNLVNALNGPDGHVEFLRDINQFINARQNELIFKGQKPFGGEQFKASEVLAIVLNLGNVENFDRLAARNFNTNREGLKAYVKEAIDNGTLTKSHFDLAQILGQRFDKKFQEVQREHKRTYGRYAKLASKDFPLKDVVPSEWGVKSGWYAPIKTTASPVTSLNWFSKKAPESAARAQQEFAQSGYLETLTDLISETPIEASYERDRSTQVQGPRMSLDTGQYINHLLKIEKVNHIREASVIANRVFLDPNVTTLLDSVAPGVLENTIWPALKSFNDQSVHSGAIGDIRMESAYESTSKLATAVTGLATKLQIAWNVKTALLNSMEGAKVADLLAREEAQFKGKSDVGLVTPSAKRAFNMANFLTRYADLMLHRNKYNYYRDLSPYIQGRQLNNMNAAKEALDANLMQTRAFRANLPVSRKAAQVNAYFTANERFLDHWTQGVTDVTTFSLFLESYLERGIEMNEAIRMAERAVETTMPGYYAHELYGALNNTSSRVAFQYTNWSVKTLNYGRAAKRSADYQFADNMLKRWGAFAPSAFMIFFFASAYQDAITGMFSGRNNLDDMADDFMADPALATARLTSQMAASPLQFLPGIGGGAQKMTLGAFNAVIDKTLGEGGNRDGYLSSVYGAGKKSSVQDFINLPVSAVGDKLIDVGTGLWKYGTEGEYMRAYDFFNGAQYKAASPGDIAADLMALANMAQLPVPAGPAPRNTVKFLFNLAAEQDNWSDSGMLLDLLRGRGENLRAQGSASRSTRRGRGQRRGRRQQR